MATGRPDDTPVFSSAGFSGSYDDDDVGTEASESLPLSMFMPPVPVNQGASPADFAVFSAPATAGNSDGYLFPEDATRTRKSWGERMSYLVGASVLCGAGLGAAIGTVEGMRTPDRPTFRLRANAVLNACGRRGRALSTAAGVTVLMYSTAEAGLSSLTGTDSALNHVAAAGLAGLVYRAGSGPRAAAVATAVGATSAAVVMSVRRVAPHIIPA